MVFFFVVAFLALHPDNLFAQTGGTGIVVGTVTDPSGAADSRSDRHLNGYIDEFGENGDDKRSGKVQLFECPARKLQPDHQQGGISCGEDRQSERGSG